MDKLQMAHDFAMKLIAVGATNKTEDIIRFGWEYADAMQAELDERKPKGLPKALSPEVTHLNNTLAVQKMVYDDEFQATGYETPTDEWQPDWSQAPKNMNYFFMNKDGSKYWAVNKPDKPNLTEHVMNFFECGGDCYSYATSQDYQGDWKDSLREHP